MFKKLLVVFLLFGFVSGCSLVPKFDNPQDTVVRLRGEHALCSAVVIGPGRLLTAAHCMDITTYVEYKNTKVPYTQRYVDRRQDIAFIEAVGVECPCSPILHDELTTYETIYKYGYALNIELLNRTIGEFQGYIHMPQGQQWMFHTAAAAPGDSGGGVFVYRWGQYYLVGITSAIAVAETQSGPQLVYHMSIAVPMSALRP